jgi:hypothetical protein
VAELALDICRANDHRHELRQVRLPDDRHDAERRPGGHQPAPDAMTSGVAGAAVPRRASRSGAGSPAMPKSVTSASICSTATGSVAPLDGVAGELENVHDPLEQIGLVVDDEAAERGHGPPWRRSGLGVNRHPFRSG